MHADHQRKQLAQIVLEEDLDLADVWAHYFAIGGNTSEEKFALYAVGQCELISVQRDLISIALREVVDKHSEATGRPTTRQRPPRPPDYDD